MQDNNFKINNQELFEHGQKMVSAIDDQQYMDSLLTDNSSSIYQRNKENSKAYESYLSEAFSDLMEINYQTMGAGSFDYLYPKLLTRFDKFNKKFYTPNQVYNGYVFVTRPRLCLTGANLQANRYMQLYNTTKPDTTQFALRCLLDTRFSSPHTDSTTAKFNSPYFDPFNPFIPLLTNTLQDMSGAPSQHIETYTSEGGYFSEDIRFAVGSDRNNKSFDVSMTFTDVEGGLVNHLFKLWLTYIDLVTVGECIAYPDDIIHQRLNYTVSIYRFLMDPTNRFIESCAKFTGCFPVDRPSGARFDISRGERYVEAAKNFTIQFACNKFEEDDPVILLEFNTLMQRYCPGIAYQDNIMESAPYGLDYNYVGLPYIKLSDKHRPILDFRYIPSMHNVSASEKIQETDNKIESAKQLYSPVWL